MKFQIALHKIRIAAIVILAVVWGSAQADANNLSRETATQLGKNLIVGDIVFIQVGALPFQKVASTTQSWVNHVGIVVDVSGSEPVLAESTFPVSRTSSLSHFVARSQDDRVAVTRWNKPLTKQESQKVWEASDKRLGIFYDTGFDLHSKRQFCSRFVREILAESTGVTVGEVETFKTLLGRNPNADLNFWRIWYFGNIPWQRETVTPASLLRDNHFHVIFDGFTT